MGRRAFSAALFLPVLLLAAPRDAAAFNCCYQHHLTTDGEAGCKKHFCDTYDSHTKRPGQSKDWYCSGGEKSDGSSPGGGFSGPVTAGNVGSHIAVRTAGQVGENIGSAAGAAVGDFLFGRKKKTVEQEPREDPEEQERQRQAAAERWRREAEERREARERAAEDERLKREAEAQRAAEEKRKLEATKKDLLQELQSGKAPAAATEAGFQWDDGAEAKPKKTIAVRDHQGFMHYKEVDSSGQAPTESVTKDHQGFYHHAIPDTAATTSEPAKLKEGFDWGEPSSAKAPEPKSQGDKQTVDLGGGAQKAEVLKEGAQLPTAASHHAPAPAVRSVPPTAARSNPLAKTGADSIGSPPDDLKVQQKVGAFGTKEWVQVPEEEDTHKLFLKQAAEAESEIKRCGFAAVRSAKRSGDAARKAWNAYRAGDEAALKVAAAGANAELARTRQTLAKLDASCHFPPSQEGAAVPTPKLTDLKAQIAGLTVDDFSRLYGEISSGLARLKREIDEKLERLRSEQEKRKNKPVPPEAVAEEDKALKEALDQERELEREAAELEAQAADLAAKRVSK